MYDLWSEGGRQASADVLADLFFGLTRIMKPKLFIEAGAKAATTSLKVRELVPKARIVAFEANPYNVELYRKKHDYSASNVEYLHHALSNKAGDLTFYIRKTVAGESLPPETGRSSILKRNDASTTYDEVTVPAVVLDAFFPKNEPNCIWMDVEGATQQVLEGGSRLLRSTKVAIIEAADRQIWEGQWLAPKTIEYMLARDLVPVARDFEYKGQYNIVFVSKDALARDEVRRNLEYFYSVGVKKAIARNEQQAES